MHVITPENVMEIEQLFLSLDDVYDEYMLSVTTDSYCDVITAGFSDCIEKSVYPFRSRDKATRILALASLIPNYHCVLQPVTGLTYHHFFHGIDILKLILCVFDKRESRAKNRAYNNHVFKLGVAALWHDAGHLRGHQVDDGENIATALTLFRNVFIANISLFKEICTGLEMNTRDFHSAVEEIISDSKFPYDSKEVSSISQVFRLLDRSTAILQSNYRSIYEGLYNEFRVKNPQLTPVEFVENQGKFLKALKVEASDDMHPIHAYFFTSQYFRLLDRAIEKNQKLLEIITRT